ncbi:MAG: hypothetical protein QRY74_06370 [Chlamydia sp.]
MILLQPIRQPIYEPLPEPISFEAALQGTTAILVIAQIAALIFQKIACIRLSIPFFISFGVGICISNSLHHNSLFSHYHKKIIEWNYSHPYLVNCFAVVAGVVSLIFPRVGIMALIITGIFEGYLSALNQIKK